MLAAMHGKSDMAELILRCGADPGPKNKFGDTAAGLAHLKGHMKTEKVIEEQLDQFEVLGGIEVLVTEQAGEPTLPLGDARKELGL